MYEQFRVRMLQPQCTTEFQAGFVIARTYLVFLQKLPRHQHWFWVCDCVMPLSQHWWASTWWRTSTGGQALCPVPTLLNNHLEKGWWGEGRDDIMINNTKSCWRCLSTWQLCTPVMLQRHKITSLVLFSLVGNNLQYSALIHRGKRGLALGSHRDSYTLYKESVICPPKGSHYPAMAIVRMSFQAPLAARWRLIRHSRLHFQTTAHHTHWHKRGWEAWGGDTYQITPSLLEARTPI